jgi:hypothetical protein
LAAVATTQPVTARKVAVRRPSSSTARSPTTAPGPLRTRRCEWCDTLTDVETHQVRKLADLARTDGRNPGGRSSWPRCAGRPWWSAPLPSSYPPREHNHAGHGVVAGEPRAGKLARGVRTGGLFIRKRTRLRRAPRQRPTGVESGGEGQTIVDGRHHDRLGIVGAGTHRPDKSGHHRYWALNSIPGSGGGRGRGTPCANPGRRRTGPGSRLGSFSG